MGKVQQIQRDLQTLHEFNSPWSPNWSDDNEEKHVVYTNGAGDYAHVEYATERTGHLLVFQSEEIAQNFLFHYNEVAKRLCGLSASDLYLAMYTIQKDAAKETARVNKLVKFLKTLIRLGVTTIGTKALLKELKIIGD